MANTIRQTNIRCGVLIPCGGPLLRVAFAVLVAISLHHGWGALALISVGPLGLIVGYGHLDIERKVNINTSIAAMGEWSRPFLVVIGVILGTALVAASFLLRRMLICALGVLVRSAPPRWQAVGSPSPLDADSAMDAWAACAALAVLTDSPPPPAPRRNAECAEWTVCLTAPPGEWRGGASAIVVGGGRLRAWLTAAVLRSAPGEVEPAVAGPMFSQVTALSGFSATFHLYAWFKIGEMWTINKTPSLAAALALAWLALSEAGLFGFVAGRVYVGPRLCVRHPWGRKSRRIADNACALVLLRNWETPVADVLVAAVPSDCPDPGRGDTRWMRFRAMGPTVRPDKGGIGTRPGGLPHLLAAWGAGTAVPTEPLEERT